MWGALLRAELIRRGRGRAQYVLRAAWVVALYGIVVGLYAAGTYGLGVEGERIGAFILGQLRDGQAMIGCTLAAAIGARGLYEDRVGGALELVALTRMSPVQRWLERTAVHQLQLMGLALASGGHLTHGFTSPLGKRIPHPLPFARMFELAGGGAAEPAVARVCAGVRGVHGLPRVAEELWLLAAPGHLRARLRQGPGRLDRLDP